MNLIDAAKAAQKLIERLVDCSHNYGDCSNVRVRDDLSNAIAAAEKVETVRLQCTTCGTFYEEGVPPCTTPPAAIPTGWQLVPVEPTPEMMVAAEKQARIDAGLLRPMQPLDSNTWHNSAINRYKAMLAAAPKPPQTPDVVRDAACKWRCEDDIDMPDTWDGECGVKWSFIEGGPIENNVNFCPECGKKVQLDAAIDEAMKG